MLHKAVIVTSSVVVVFGAVAHGSRLIAQDVLHGWTASQMTRALVLNNVQERTGGAVTLSLKNISGKVITACAASSPPAGPSRYRHFVDYLDADSDNLPNGATVEWKISPEEAASNIGHVFEIDAVIFDDGTADGLQVDIDFMNAKRVGRVFETERLSGLLARLNTDPPDLEALKSSIGLLPDSVQAALASLKDADPSRISLAKISGSEDNGRAFLSGVRLAREEALWKLKGIAEPSQTAGNNEVRTQASAVLELKQAYEKKVNMYRGRGQQLLGRLPQ